MMSESTDLPIGEVARKITEYYARDSTEFPPPDGDETKTHIFKEILAAAKEKQMQDIEPSEDK